MITRSNRRPSGTPSSTSEAITLTRSMSPFRCAFAAAHATLAQDPGLAARTRLLTISFDTAHDTPDVLRAFGKPFQKTTPPFTHWALATGKDEAIRALGGALELDYVEESRSFTHNLRTAVLDGEGKLRRLFRGSDWTPEELVAELRAAAGS